MELSELLTTRIKLADHAQKPKMQLFTDLDEIYHVKGKPQESEGQLHAPDSYANIETIAPRMVARRPTLIFKPRPDPLFKMRDEEARGMVADRQAAVWGCWWDKDGAFTKNVTWVKGSLRHGTKIVRTCWKYELSEVTDYIYDEQGLPMVGEDGKFIEEKREEVTKDDASMETISSYDFFIDPEAKDIQSAAWIIFRFRQTVDQLKGYGNYKRLKELEGLLTDKTASEHAERSREVSGLNTLEDDSTIERVTVYEMWEKGPKGIRKCTVAAKSVVIEEWKPNPYRHRQYPFIRLIDSIVDEEFWGKGEIEPVMSFQYALDTYHSLDVSNRIKALEGKGKIDGTIDEWEVTNGPYIHVNTRQGSDFEYLDIPDYTATSGPAIELTRSTMSSALGIFDVNRGDADSSNTTATGIGITAEQGNARFNLKIQHYEEALKELGFQIVSLYQQHKTDLFQIEVENDQGVKEMQTLAPLDIAGSFDIEVESGSSRPANKEAERQDALQVYQLIQPLAQQDPSLEMEAMKFVLSKFDGVGKLKEAVEQSFQKVQQQQEMMQGQMMEQQAQEQEMMQGQQQEQTGIEDHQTKMAYYDNEEQKLNEQIMSLEKVGA